MSTQNRTPVNQHRYSFIVAVGLLLSGCGRSESSHPSTANTATPNQTPVPVRVQPAERRQFVLTEEVVGTVRAKTQATLEAKISGRIEEMPVRLGQSVKSGDLVARLDSAEVSARLEQAHAALAQTERDWTRIAALFKGQAVTGAEHDRAEAAHRAAKAAVAEAEAVMRYVEIRAPFDGVVSRKWVEVGDLASPGKPLISLVDPSALQLEADVPETLAPRIEPGIRWAVQLDGLDGQATGQVVEVAPVADPATRTVRVKLDLPQAPGLFPGRFARLLVPVGESAQVVVPASAVTRRGQLAMVFVVTNQMAHLHLVKTGRQDRDDTVVLSGLEPGEAVVVQGAAQLRDGQRVEAR